MPRNGSGTYTLPANSFNPASPGGTISSTAWNATGSDLATAMTASLAKDGQTTATARIPFALGIGLPDGSVGAPALNATSDDDTGIYFPAAAQVAVALGGVQALLVSASGLTLATALAVAQGGTGATTAGGARTNLGFSANGSSLVTAADYSAMRTLLSLVPGTNVVAYGGALGTPTSGTLSNCTGYTASNLGGLGTGVGTWLATPSSANLRTAMTDETGTGSLVFATSPTLTTPTIGAAVATSISIGGNVYLSAGAGTRSLIVGPGGPAAGNYSVSVGEGATSAGAYAVALGSATASGAGALAIGHTTTAAATECVAIGEGATVASGHTNSVAIGRSATTTAANEIMLGVSGHTVVVPGSITVAGGIRQTAKTVATLPSAALGYATDFVTDAAATLAANLGNVVTGGGSNKSPVWSDGTSWRQG